MQQLTHLLDHPEVRVTRAPEELLPPVSDASVPLVGYLVLAPAGTQPAELITYSAGPPEHQVAPRAAATQSDPAATAAAVSAAGPATAPMDGGSAATFAEFEPSNNGLSIDVERRMVTVDGVAVPLTYLEFELLAYLVRHPHRVFTRGQLVSRVWGYLPVGDERTVDVHVARLRRKLGGRYRARIVTVRRVGYKYSPGDRYPMP